jgi:hypothetical protein
MIQDHDRSGWFGASDTAFIVGNWNTKTFLNWWMQKIGVNRDHFDNQYTLAGTHFEHKILESLGVPGMRLDEQVRHEALLLRVNYDGLTDDCTWECKTYKLEKGWKMPKKYWQQVQVQMYAKGLQKGKVIAYGLEEADYNNFLRPIDPRRVIQEDIRYDPVWINTVFLPRLRVLADCLRKGIMPREEMLHG